MQLFGYIFYLLASLLVGVGLGLWVSGGSTRDVGIAIGFSVAASQAQIAKDSYFSKK